MAALLASAFPCEATALLALKYSSIPTHEIKNDDEAFCWGKLPPPSFFKLTLLGLLIKTSRSFSYVIQVSELPLSIKV